MSKRKKDEKIVTKDEIDDIMEPGTPKGGQRQINITPRQKKAVDIALKGDWKTKREVLEKAGYTGASTRYGFKALKNSKGAQLYLERLERRSREKYGVGLQEQSAKVLLDGLEATKPTKEGDYPDYAVRGQYLDRLNEVIGVKDSPLASEKSHNQFNFFMTSKEDQENFNEKFKRMMKDMVGKEG